MHHQIRQNRCSKIMQIANAFLTYSYNRLLRFIINKYFNSSTFAKFSFKKVCPCSTTMRILKSKRAIRIPFENEISATIVIEQFIISRTRIFSRYLSPSNSNANISSNPALYDDVRKVACR